MSKTRKYIIVLILAIAAVICAAFALGTGCKGNSQYEVKFVTGDHTPVATMKVDRDETITLPMPDEEDGYVFKGWYLSDDYSGSQYSASASFTVTENTTFYGKYNVLAKLTLLSGEDSKTQTVVSLEEGEAVSSYLGDNVAAAEWERHEFYYWADENGNALSSTILMPAEGLTLTAVYKVEVRTQVWVRYDGQTEPVHMEEYDAVTYEEVGTTNVTLVPSTPTGLSTSQNQGTDGNDTLARVDTDPDKNILKIYYDAQTVQWSFYTNYPAETGLSDAVCSSGEVIFGEYVDVPTDVTCYGYLLVGWATSPDATTPDYYVDVVSANTMVWDATEAAYVYSGASVTADAYRPEALMSTLFAVWYRGYFDMFGSYDVVYDFGGDTVFLCRGGVFFESGKYNSGENNYTFVNECYGTDAYIVRLRDDGYFVFYDFSRSYETRYRVEYYTYTSGGYTYLGIDVRDSTSDSGSEFFAYTQYDTVDYYVGGDRVGTATYTYDADGYVVLNFTSGELSGTVYTVLLVTISYTDGSTKDGYIIRNEEEAGKKITLGGVGDYGYGDGAFQGYMDPDSVYFELSGFGTCVFYSSGSYSSYYYYLDGDALELFSSSYSYAGEYHYAEDFGEWIYYYSALDKTFDVYDADGTTKIGSVELDGMWSGELTYTNGTSERVVFYVTSYVIGDVVVLYTDAYTSGAQEYFKTPTNYLYGYDAAGTSICLTKIPETYTESYFYSPGTGLYSYQVFAMTETVDADGKGTGSGTITLYLYGYSSYGGYYTYFSVFTGNYETKQDEKYGFDYYLITDITPTYDADYWGITYYYTGYYSYADLIEMTAVAFIPTAFYVYSGSYVYLYDANIWYYTETSADEAEETSTASPYSAVYYGDEINENENPEPVRDELFAEYTGSLSFELAVTDTSESEGANGNEAGDNDDGSETEDTGVTHKIEGNAELMVVGDYLVYVTMTYTDTVVSGDGTVPADAQTEALTLQMSGYIYGSYDYKDINYETYTLYLVYLNFGYEDAFYSWAVYLSFDEDAGTFEMATEVPSYIFSYSMDTDENGNVIGLVESEYITYDTWSEGDGDSIDATYVVTGEDDETSTYEGTMTAVTDENGAYVTTSTGYYLYTFNGTKCGSSDEIEFTFIVAYFGSSANGYFPVFILYNEENHLTFTGEDGSVFETDGVGLGAAYTVDGVTSQVDAYVIVSAEEDETSLGYYGQGYFEIYVNGEYYIMDFVEDTEGAGYDYTTRGQEAWYVFYVIDNQVFQPYVFFFDGYDAVSVWIYDEEEGAYVEKGAGTYSIVDTVVTVVWTYVEEEGESTGTQYTVEGELDFYSSYSYGYVWVNHTEYVSKMVYAGDLSVLVLDGYGDAVRYLSDGSYEYGQYTILDGTYLYYVNYEGSAAYVYRYSFEKGTISPVNYGEELIYFTSDMTRSMKLTDYGRVTFDGSSYYFYVKEDSKVYIYYTTSSMDDPNEYGYVKSGAITLGDTLTLGGETYTKITVGETLTFTRDSSDGNNYGYLVYDSSSGQDTVYTLGELSFKVNGSAFEDDDGEEGVAGTITITHNGSSVTGTAYVYRDYVGNGVYEIYIVLGAGYYSYYDYFLYDITLDLGTRTYKVTSMELDEVMYSYDYMYLSYYANIYLNYYYYALMYYSWTGLSYYYYLAEEYYEYYYYYAYLASYYYSYVILTYEYDENCENTGLYASGYFMPYLYSTAQGSLFSFYMVPVQYSSSGYYYIDLGEIDGYEYSLSFGAYSGFMSYFGYYAFVTEAFVGYETYETAHNENEDYYEVEVGTLIYSDYYSSTGGIWSIGLTKYTYDSSEYSYGEGEWISGLTILEINGNLYFVHVEYDEEGEFSNDVFYKIVFTYDEETGVTSVEVSVSEAVTVYTTDNGHLDFFTETDNETGETYETIVFVCEETYDDDGNLESRLYYYATSEKNQEGTYTVTYGGNTYTVTLTTESEGSHTATMEPVTDEENAEGGGTEETEEQAYGTEDVSCAA